jgi:uncharacterized membrane protein
MGLDSGIYKVLFVLHLLTVIVGFGPLMLAGLFGAKAKARGGREGHAIAESTYDVMNTAQWAVYATPILGILLVLTSDDVWKFSQTWISLSFLLYFVALGLSHAVHLKNLRRMNELMAELAAGPAAGPSTAGGPPSQAVELEERGKQAALVGGILNLMVVIIVALMVFKPGV